jgi:tetratricopeptide (TPR) repeat protein
MMGGGMNEPSIIAALGAAQLGQIDEALALVDEIEISNSQHPFADSVSALVLAMAHEPQRALTHATAALEAPGATYLDLIFANIGAGSAHLQLGERERADDAFQAAAAKAAAVGDVVAIALATHAQQRVLGDGTAGNDEESDLADGWRRVVEALVVPTEATSAGERV